MNGPPLVPKKRRNNRLLWVCIVGIMLTPFLVLLAVYLGFRVSNAKAVSRLEARARAKGEPLTLAELALKYPSLPEADNAAVPLLQLWEKEEPAFWQAFRRGERPLPERSVPPIDPALPYLGREARRVPRSGSLPPASRAAAEAYLKERAEHLEAVRLALQRPRCCFPVKVTDGLAALLPYLANMRGEAQNFQIVGALAVERGDVDAAIAALEDIGRTGQALAEHPLLLDQSTRIGCLGMAQQGAQRLLSRQPLSAAQLGRLEALFQRLQVPGALRIGLIAERVSFLSLFDLPAASLAQIGNGPGEDPEQATARAYHTGMGLLRATGMVAADRRLILESMEQAIARAGEDSPAALERYEQVFIQASEEARRFPPKIFSMMMLPTLDRTGTRFAAFEARRRAGLAAIAVERYRISHNGHLPDKLEELVPDYFPQLPADPFNGQPLRFRHLQTGFVIYSVGADRQDDGGKERPQKGPVKNYDETFIVER